MVARPGGIECLRTMYFRPLSSWPVTSDGSVGNGSASALRAATSVTVQIDNTSSQSVRNVRNMRCLPLTRQLSDAMTENRRGDLIRRGELAQSDAGETTARV